MKKPIECIHFDLDSVLYISSDFLETTLLMSVKSMIQMGLRAEEEEALLKLKEIRAKNSNAKDHFDRLCRHFNKTFDPLIIAAGVERYWDCKVGILTSAPETHHILSAFYGAYPLTVISNGPPVKQAGKVIRLGLSHFFSQYDSDLRLRRHFFFATEDEMRRKPYPHLWLEAREAIGFDFARAVMIGDRYWHDIFGANRLGMITVKVTQGPHADEPIDDVFQREWRSEATRAFFSRHHTEDEICRLMEPDYTINSLNELAKTIQRIVSTY